MTSQLEQLILEKPIIYDFDELEEVTDYPARLVRMAVKPLLESMITDPEWLGLAYEGAGEAIKDVEVHGDKSSPRQVIISEETEGLVIDTSDVEKPTSEHNNFGRLILEQVFGGDYSVTKEDGVFKSHLLIRRENKPIHPLDHAA